MNYIVNRLTIKYKIQNFNTFFVFGKDNNISLLKKFYRFVFTEVDFSDSNKELYFNVFSKIRSTIYAFTKLVSIWREKKAKISSTSYDLILNPLSDYPDSQKVKLYHNKTIYTFRLTDVINIWLNALCKSYSLIPSPEMPKNPYTNIEFDKGHLLKFYIYIRFKSKFMVPKLIQEYINCEMNLRLFKVNNYPDLVDAAIKTHLNNETDELLYFDCIRMVSKYKRRLRNRVLSNDICIKRKIKAVKILKPLLKKYLYSTYSCNPRIQSINKINLVKDLKSVFKKNALLGRRIFIPSRQGQSDLSTNIVIDHTVNNAVNTNINENNNEDDYNSTDTEIAYNLESESEDEEELFDEESVFFYQTFENSHDLTSDEDDEVNQVD